MKFALRCRPEDFLVEELIDLEVGSGPFALYRLEKWGLGTPEALAAISRKWHIPPHRITWAGLKDRHARTTQYITIQSGPRSDLAQSKFRLEYLGQVPQAIQSKNIQANRFVIVVRRLRSDQADEFVRRLQVAFAQGWPNYFDEQRFGSCGFSGEFVAEAWCQRDFERALWLALADPYRHDSSAERREKQWLRYHWRHWDEALANVRHPVRRRVLRILAEQPTKWRQAFAAIPVTLRRIYLSAFQSFLWNSLLSRWITEHLPAESRFNIEVAEQQLAVPKFTGQATLKELVAISIPLPSARNRTFASPWGPWLEEILRARGLQLGQLQIKYPRDSFFSKGERPAWVQPTDLSYRLEQDTLYPGRVAVVMEFKLQRGAYATLLFRCLGSQW